MTTSATTRQVPLVDYLVLGDIPHLVVNSCTSCGARYFDRRNACAGCFGTGFEKVRIPTRGVVTAFTIVRHAAPGVETPFVAATIDCGGTAVAGNVIGVAPEANQLATGMTVQLALTSLGTDTDGVEAIGFAFAPTE